MFKNLHLFPIVSNYDKEFNTVKDKNQTGLKKFLNQR